MAHTVVMIRACPNHGWRRKRAGMTAAGVALALGLTAPPYAKAGPSDRPAAPPRPVKSTNAAAATPSSAKLDVLHQHDQELADIRRAQEQNNAAESKLRSEILSLGSDRRKLNDQLISAAARVRTIESGIATAEDKLAPLADREKAIRKSLDDRRTVIAEVLAALERIGHRPPPALLVRPDDALQALRSAMLLGAVLPEMHDKATALATDLNELVRLRKDIADQRDKLQHDLATLSDERHRLSLLIEERQKKQASTEAALATTRQQAIALARNADSVQELITKLEKGLDPATRAARLAAREPDKSAPAGQDDTGRLQPAIAFAAARGRLPLPVNGVKLRDYGAPDGVGGSEKGLLIATRGRAEVTSPCDGWVVYSGPFRSYGQLLILDAGGGYHVLLAGMDRVSVDIGQFVLTGEPIAVMGSGSKVAAILTAGSSQPVLYVEFRKDGTPIDPSPWWAKSDSEKVRG